MGHAETERVPIRRHENTGTSAMELISFFIKERTDKVVLDLQEDLVTKNKDLIDTEAGKEARGQLAEGVEQTRRELEDTKAELREALRTQNKDMALKLSKERVDSSNKMEKLQKDYEIFRENMQQKFEGANKRQEAKIRGLIQEKNTLKTAKMALTTNNGRIGRSNSNRRRS